MIDEYEKRKRKQIALMRSLLDYGLGIGIIVGGVFLFIKYKSDLTLKLFGAACVLYGAWRIYRGYKKNYFQ